MFQSMFLTDSKGDDFSRKKQILSDNGSGQFLHGCILALIVPPSHINTFSAVVDGTATHNRDP